MTPEYRSQNAMARLTTELTGDYDAQTLLQYICDESVRCLDVVLATLVVMDSDKQLNLLAASSDGPLGRGSEGLFSSGPSAESARNGGISLTDDIRHEPTRWPETAALMSSLDLIGVRGFPLRLFGRPLGSLTLYTRDIWGSDRGSLVGQSFADLAVLVLAQDEVPDRRLQSVAAVVTSLVDQRAHIYQAQGMVAEYTGASIEGASTVLRTYAQRQALPEARVARWIVQGSVSIETLTDPS